MKYSVILVLVQLFLALTLNAQTHIVKKFNYSGQQVKLNLKFADSIEVNYWDKPEVNVDISVSINGGKLNDALKVKTSDNAEDISLDIDLDSELIKTGKAEDCPGTRHIVQSDGKGNGYAVCSRLSYIVNLPKSAKLHLETINGNITIKGSGAPVYAKSISGYVDLSLPASKGANLSMKSITGELYSDVDIAFTTPKQKHAMVGYTLNGTTKGGGPEMRLESISNNIYLRKGK